MADFSEDIVKIGDEIAGLSLKQAVEVAEYLKENYGIEPAAGGGAVMMAPGAGGGDGGAAEEAEEKTEFDVVLKAAGDQKIKVIKAVREATGLGLKEAKELVDGAPSTVKEALPKEEADKLAEAIKDAGGDVEL
ncbi:MAG: 50S ribosomal protein L7/L12, partial [Planctomycetota bacterium]